MQMRSTFLSIASMFVFANAAFGEALPTNECSGRKARVTADLYKCLMKEQGKVLRGRTADFAKCTAKLEDKFDTIEARYSCGLVSDSARAIAHATAEANQLYDALGAVTDDNRRCMVGALRYAAGFVKCEATLVGNFAATGTGGRQENSCLERLQTSMSRNASCDGTGLTVDPNVIVGASCYLPGADLPDREFPFLMQGADLEGANLTSSLLRLVDLRDANLTDTVLIGVDLYHIALAGADMRGSDLSNAYSTQMTSCPAYLPSDDWLCWTNPDDSYVFVGPYINAHVLAYEPANFAGLDVTGANLGGSQFPSADFTGAKFVGTNVNGAFFTDANLTNADFTGASLNQGHLDGANFTGVNLTNANLAYASLDSVTWSATTCPDGTVSDANAGTCCGHHVGVSPYSCSP